MIKNKTSVLGNAIPVLGTMPLKNKYSDLTAVRLGYVPLVLATNGGTKDVGNQTTFTLSYLIPLLRRSQELCDKDTRALPRRNMVDFSPVRPLERPWNAPGTPLGSNELRPSPETVAG